MQRTAATRAKLQSGVRTGKMRAQPMAACGTLLIDALHGPTGQVLHVASPSGRYRQSLACLSGRSSKDAGLWSLLAVVSRRNHTRYRGPVASMWISCEAISRSRHLLPINRRRESGFGPGQSGAKNSQARRYCKFTALGRPSTSATHSRRLSETSSSCSSLSPLKKGSAIVRSPIASVTGRGNRSLRYGA